MTDWKNSLGTFFEQTEGRSRAQKEGSELARYIRDVVVPAFEEVRTELVKHGRHVTIRDSEASASLIVTFKGEEEICYRIHGRSFPNTVIPCAEIRFRERKGLRMITTESMLRSGPADYALFDVTVDEVIRNFLENYMRRVRPEKPE